MPQSSPLHVARGDGERSVEPLPGQLAMPGVIGLYWVESIGHGIVPDGTEFLIVQERQDGWLVGWKNGAKPRHCGTLLKPERTRRVSGGG